MSKSLIEIYQKPYFESNIHESVFRCYSVLEKVMEMVNRGDSKETIQEVVSMLGNIEISDVPIKPDNFYKT